MGLRKERGRRGFKEGFRGFEGGISREKGVVLESGCAQSCGSHCRAGCVERRKERTMEVVPGRLNANG